ncbi:TetR/AcrR family transcriptional regulator [Rhodococcus fascians]|nr:TetR/AcrR family transcriptional regulator [Rhodococcus fascians]
MTGPVRPTSSRYDDLLERLVDHVVTDGMSNLSVRTAAAAVGVAHNTVTYHFGNRASLQRAIFSRLSDRIKAETDAVALQRGAVTDRGKVPARLRAVWEWVSREEARSMWATFFEAFAQAAREPGPYQDFLDHLRSAWMAPLVDELTAAGRSEADARARATLVIAAVRGLIIEVLCAGPAGRASADAAFEQLLELFVTWLPGRSQ